MRHNGNSGCTIQGAVEHNEGVQLEMLNHSTRLSRTIRQYLGTIYSQSVLGRLKGLNSLTDISSPQKAISTLCPREDRFKEQP